AWGWNGDGVLGTLSVKATVLSPELVVFEGEPAETNYDEHDYEVLRDFFETADENGVKNGEKCFPNYDPDDPATWFDKVGIYANAVYWNESGKVSSVHLEGTEEEDLILTGRIDLAQFDSLTDFGLWNAVIESVVADNMVTAGNMQLSNLKFPYVAREARFTGAYAERLYMLSASHTLVEMTGEATIETWLLPAFRIEVDVEGMGYAGVVSWDDENAYEVRLMAEPMDGASFLGWFDEKGTLISTELTYELYGEASGRSCEGRHAELAYTARFTDHYHDREWAVNAAFITAQAIGRVHGMEFDRDEAEWNVQDYDGIVEEYVSFTDRNGHGELVTFFHPDRLVNGAVPPSYFDLWPAEADIPGGIDAWRSRYDSETVTITPDDIRAHGCTATEGEEYVRAAYECWAEKLAQRLVKAGSDDPARCTEAALVYCEPDEDYPGNWFFRIAVKPASTENFAAFTDWTLGFIDGRFPAEYYGWVNFWGRTELTENADGSFTAPFILDTGA
ncbi:MAG: hypothetical protein J6P98_00940, partial [Clostridia bacterium]|nr:hypothetical protein [Clostridia bacterium]